MSKFPEMSFEFLDNLYFGQKLVPGLHLLTPVRYWIDVEMEKNGGAGDFCPHV